MFIFNYVGMPRRYKFEHSAVYEALLELTPSSDQKRIHLAAARYYERTNGGEDMEALYATIACHYLQSEDTNRVKTMEYCVRAGSHACRMEFADVGDGLEFFQVAVGLLSNSKQVVITNVFYCKCNDKNRLKNLCLR